MPAYTITTLTNGPAVVAALAELLVSTVAHGGSVSFMHPLAPEEAAAFWATSLAAADRGERVVLGAFDDAQLIGTVTLLLNCPPNQPHRAEVAKMMTHVNYRGQGIARSLLERAEGMAKEKGKTLLTLDTASEEGASGLYEKSGYQRAGEIPYYAFKPHGGLSGTILYWKLIGD
ncbi:GNAT family N-acetyltransferase [Chitinophaga arvensicola]|uniref:Acetyltransferase (GNAT) family protein n=1 Tax=Chitinophaga arvensicola TaxID=29529 RepID=A0A1I0SD45_9BACT|nr:GNAT family N-acetyltransferase [Chitinophaga arvensicola]SEW55870.1 Acetyltransferase (GNAT) family protein [Chitinophaga arvensicola]